MSEIDKLKAELTTWLDERIAEAVKAGVDEANTDLMKDLDTRFGSLEFSINNLSGLVDSMSKDVGKVVDSVAGLATTVLAIPNDMAKTVEATIRNLNPFHI